MRLRNTGIVGYDFKVCVGEWHELYGNRAVNIDTSFVTVQEHGKIWPCGKVDHLLIYNAFYTIRLDSLSPSRRRLETVLDCATCTK